MILPAATLSLRARASPRAWGGAGNDTYSYAAGGGVLSISEGGGDDRIVLASGITSGDITLAASGSDLLITDGTGGDTITLKNQLSSVAGVETLEFDGGSTMALNGITLTATSATLNGTAGSDTLIGTTGTQTLKGNGGNDTFITGTGPTKAIGGIGDDTYSYASGDGQLTIQESGGDNRIVLATGISTGDVSLTASGQNLLITDSVGGDTITLLNQLSSAMGVSELVFSGGSTIALEGLDLTMPGGVYSLNGTAGSDTLTATGGTQTLRGNGGNDTFVASTGTETAYGGGGNDLFMAGAGTQKFYGYGGNDTFVTGSGVAYAYDDSGDDLYSYTSGSGELTIDEGKGTDTIKLGAGLTAANVTITETNGHDLLIVDGVSGDKITVLNHAYSGSPSGDQVEELIFGDGSSVSLTEDVLLHATDGATTLQAQNGNDTLIAASGNSGTESLLGRLGNDIYSYESGDGSVYIYDAGGTDTLKLGSGLTAANVTVSQSANTHDLIITDGTGGDEIRIAYHSQFSANAVDMLVYGDGTSVSLVSGVTMHAYTGTASLDGTSGNDTLIGSAGTQTIWGEGGSDIFIAATGTTKVFGNSGNDLYSYESGNGALIIDEASGTDTIKLGSGLTAANVILTETNGYDLLIKDGVSGDVITVLDQTYNATASGYNVETLIYGDSTSVSLTGNLLMQATDGNTTLQSLNGNDTLIAANGNTGTESLLGRAGNDVYSYDSGSGSVYIYDTGGADTIKLGTGLTSANVSLTQSVNGKDLIITDGVSGDTITVHNNYYNSSYAVETILYGDGSTLDLSITPLTAAAGNTTLNGTSGADILVGTAGNQTLYGNGGSGPIYRRYGYTEDVR